MTNSTQPLLSMRLSVHYPGKSWVLSNIALEIQQGEILGLVGQSGSGKSTLALAILGLLEMKRAKAEGTIHFRGSELLRLSEREMRAIRGRAIGLVSQSPLSSLNPALKIRTQLQEAWRAHATGTSTECEVAIRKALTNVSLPGDDKFLTRYPSQLSVGQAQRVLIAMAVLHRPGLLLTDEATSALDVITQSEILALFARLNRENNMSILYISHDLPSVAGICHRIAILHEGKVVECSRTEQVFNQPQHPYTQRLISSLPERPATATTAKATAAFR